MPQDDHDKRPPVGGGFFLRFAPQNLRVLIESGPKPDNRRKNTTETKTEEILGTKEVAAPLKIEPRVLRTMLRKINGKAPGERYEWKASDPFLKKLPELMKAATASGH